MTRLSGFPIAFLSFEKNKHHEELSSTSVNPKVMGYMPPLPSCASVVITIPLYSPFICVALMTTIGQTYDRNPRIDEPRVNNEYRKVLSSLVYIEAMVPRFKLSTI